MDISEYTKQTGTFLTAQDVLKDPDALWEITGEGEIVTNKFGNQRLHLLLFPSVQQHVEQLEG